MSTPTRNTTKRTGLAEGLFYEPRHEENRESRDFVPDQAPYRNAKILVTGDNFGCASTSNRNFAGRQGAGGRTHLVSPAMAAAAAISGHFTDVRKLTVN